MAEPVYVLNGPNLDLLGRRDPKIYGTRTLRDVEHACAERLREKGLSLVFRQRNGEGDLIDLVHEAADASCGVIINAGAYAHTSLALFDALQQLSVPIVEVHVSNVFAREEERSRSYVARAADGVICGFGLQGYLLAIDAVAARSEGRSRAARSESPS